jgi:DNA invertase Pin-like site-specific DNA recombinase
MIAVTEDLRSRGIDLVITTMGVDTSTAAGRFFYNVIGAVAEFEARADQGAHAGIPLTSS